MKLSKLFPTAQELAIKLPDGENSGIVLKVTSVDSAAPRAIAREYAQSLVGQEKADVARMDAYNANVVAACVVGWSGLEDENGEPLPYSADKARELLANPELMYVREQVEAFVSSRANFFRTSKAAAG